MLETLPARDAITAADLTSTIDEPALVRRISRQIALPQVDRDALAKVLDANVRALRPRTTLIDAGSALSEASVVIEGWACSFTRIGARRQIVAFHLPGDICNLDAFLLGRSDQTIASIGDLRVAGIGRSTLNLLARRCPKASHGLLWASAQGAATQRRWTLNVGQRGAKKRLAFLLYDLWQRASAVLPAADEGIALPLSQPDLADACGLTPEHTNRTLRELRQLDLLTLEDRFLKITDVDGMRTMATVADAA